MSLPTGKLRFYRKMRVTIRLRLGPKVKRKRRKNRHVALACAALLTPGALTACVLGFWRLGADLGATGQFPIAKGFFSHWQVWLGFAAAIQVLSFALNRYGHSQPAIPNSEEEPRRTLLDSGF